jgi:hypothetical protein
MRCESRRVLTFMVAAVLFGAASAQAQNYRAVVFGHVGGANIGHADSELGNAPILGGGVAVHLTPRIVVDADLHGARVTNVFGHQHNFSQVTFTGSVLFRSSPDARAHLLAGGGLAVQRGHSEFTFEPFGLIESTETVRLMHGRGGVEWDMSSRVMVRTEALLWMGGGLDWVLGGRAAVGFRF